MKMKFDEPLKFKEKRDSNFIISGKFLMFGGALLHRKDPMIILWRVMVTIFSNFRRCQLQGGNDSSNAGAVI